MLSGFSHWSIPARRVPVATAGLYPVPKRYAEESGSHDEASG